MPSGIGHDHLYQWMAPVGGRRLEHRIPPSDEARTHFLRQTSLDLDDLATAIDPRHRNSLSGRHAEVDDIADHLEHSVGDHLSARGADDDLRSLPIIQDRWG